MAARTYTRAELRTMLEQRTDTENDTHLSLSEKDNILNQAAAETWDVICESGLGEKFVKSATFSTVPDQLEYPLFTIAPDFYRVSKLYADEGNGQYRALQRISPSEVLNFRSPAAVVPMKLYYIPYSPVIPTGAPSDGQTFDGVNGWEEHLLAVAAIKVMAKKNDSAAEFRRIKAEQEDRIKTMGMVDFGEPMRIVRKRQKLGALYYPYFSQINAYVVRGDKLELYYSYPWVR